MRPIINTIYLFAFLIILFGCRNDATNEQSLQIEKENKSNPGPSLIKLNNRLFNIPSPLQITFLVKENNIKYNGNLLHDPKRASKYTTHIEKALNMGIYGANLGYLNIYERYPSASLYFAVINKIASELGVQRSYEEDLIRRIERNSSNKDSLIQILSEVYSDVDEFLQNDQRNEIGVLILTGGWVESLFLLTQSVKDSTNENILNRIGEQKYPLENIISLLRPYYNKRSEELNVLIESLVELATIYDGVVYNYTFKQPEHNVDKKITIIHSQSNVIMSDYQLQEITKRIKKIRFFITN